MTAEAAMLLSFGTLGLAIFVVVAIGAFAFVAATSNRTTEK